MGHASKGKGIVIEEDRGRQEACFKIDERQNIACMEKAWKAQVPVCVQNVQGKENVSQMLLPLNDSMFP